MTANQATAARPPNTTEGFSLVNGHQNPPTQGWLGSDSVGQVGGGEGQERILRSSQGLLLLLAREPCLRTTDIEAEDGRWLQI